MRSLFGRKIVSHHYDRHDHHAARLRGRSVRSRMSMMLIMMMMNVNANVNATFLDANVSSFVESRNLLTHFQEEHHRLDHRRHQHHHQHRSLRSLQQQQQQQGEDTDNSRPCGAIIDTITTQEVIDLANLFLNAILVPAGLESFISVAQALFLSDITYDLHVVKVCGTCDTVRQYPDVFDVSTSTTGSSNDNNNNNNNNTSFEFYCGPNAYGVVNTTALHSGLMFLPLQQMNNNDTSVASNNTTNTTRIPVFGAIRSVLTMHSTTVEVSSAPSVVWPNRFATLLQNATDDFFSLAAIGFFEYYAPMVAATTGSVFILPDYLGTLFGKIHHVRNVTQNSTGCVSHVLRCFVW
jgi:hypothetical protein